MADYEKLTADLLRKWLWQTTCARGNRLSVHKTIGGGRFVILKHAGHSEYTTRASLSRAWCGTFYCLYDLDNVVEVGIFGEPYLLKVEGRWTARAAQDAAAAIAAATEATD